MINNVMNFPQMPDVTQIRPQAVDATQAVSSTETSGKTKDSGDNADTTGGKREQSPDYQLRLTMDKDPKTGDWVYKAIDRYTGEVVKQLPRQDLLNMKDSGSYQAGSVIKTDI